MSVNRRRQRGVRASLAVALLAVAAIVVLVALLVGGALLLGGAAVVAWAAGVAATRVISNELGASRREHARDRAEQAQAYGALSQRRDAEQARFTATMRQQVEDHANTITRLRATLRLAEKRAEFAEQTASRNKVAVAKAEREIAELKARISGLEATTAGLGESAESVFDLDSMQALGDVPTVADLLGWDNRLASTPTEQRRQA